MMIDGWIRGNLHTHTSNSDGDSSPSDVARWYRDAGYQFLALTDHNRQTDVDRLQTELDRETAVPGTPSLQLIPGEEVTDAFERGRKHEVHVNAIDCPATVGPQGGGSTAQVLQRCLEAIQSAGGLAIVNHPNFRWSISTADLLALPDPFHLEIHNAHPETNNLGSLAAPGCEQVWDALLTEGRRVFGVASDDAHVFCRFHTGLPNPGHAWVACRASNGTRAQILEALRRGDYYCSTGVQLAAVTAEKEALSVRVHPVFDCRYTIMFIGAGGRVLEQVEATGARYRLAPTDDYVRAKIVSSQGDCAWTQPLFRS